MYTHIKIVEIGIVLVVGLGFALSYIPGSDASKWGEMAARYGIKGARGTKTLVESFAKGLKEGTGDDEKPKK